MRRVVSNLLLSFVFAGVVAEFAAARTWTDRTGRKLDAEFVGFADGKVQIKRTSDGATFHVPLERLCDVDQAFVRSQIPAKTKPAASPALGTPLGKYMGVGQFAIPKVKSRVLAGLVMTGDQTEAKYEHGEIKARPDEVLVGVHFHTDEALQNDVAFDQFSVVVETRSYPVLASASDLNAECFEVIRKATTQHGANRSTYLVFAIPQGAKKLRVVYGTTGWDVAAPLPAVESALAATTAKTQSPVNPKPTGQDPKPDDLAKKERDTLGGNWTVKSLQQAGESLPEDMVRAMRVVIKGDQITTFNANMNVAQVTFSVDPAKTPKEIEWRQDGKVIAKGTYSRQGHVAAEYGWR